jgi:hypothetical protein
MFCVNFEQLSRRQFVKFKSRLKSIVLATSVAIANLSVGTAAAAVGVREFSGQK